MVEAHCPCQYAKFHLNYESKIICFQFLLTAVSCLLCQLCSMVPRPLWNELGGSGEDSPNESSVGIVVSRTDEDQEGIF